MKKQYTPHYDWQPSRDYCASLGMGFDEDGAVQADKLSFTHGLSQDAFNAAMYLYADKVLWAFSPSTYTFCQRLGLAFHFIYNPRNL